jgi:hypothetical protein
MARTEAYKKASRINATKARKNKRTSLRVEGLGTPHSAKRQKPKSNSEHAAGEAAPAVQPLKLPGSFGDTLPK